MVLSALLILQSSQHILAYEASILPSVIGPWRQSRNTTQQPLFAEPEIPQALVPCGSEQIQ
jgi:hypothetical protein